MTFFVCTSVSASNSSSSVPKPPGRQMKACEYLTNIVLRAKKYRKLTPRSTHGFRPCSNGSSMPSPTEKPPASAAPRLTASIAPGPPPVITANPALASAPPSLAAELVLGVVALGARRAEHRDRARDLGERAEPLDELGLDPQDAPRVGVHPVARAARVQQPLVGGAALVAAVAAQHDRALVPLHRAFGVLAVRPFRLFAHYAMLRPHRQRKCEQRRGGEVDDRLVAGP